MSDTFPYNRVAVTGGAGFLGHFVIEKLKGYDGVEVFVPRRHDYNLIEKPDIDRMLDDSQPRRGHSSGRGGRRHRPQSEESGQVFYQT